MLYTHRICCMWESTIFVTRTWIKFMEACNGELGGGKRGPPMLALFWIYFGNDWLSLLLCCQNVIIWIFPNVFIQVIGNRREGTNWDESRKHALNTCTAFVLSYPDFQHVRCVMAEASWGVQNVFSSLLPLKQSVCISPWWGSQILALWRGACLVSSWVMATSYYLLSAEGRISSYTQGKKGKLESDRS